MVVTPDKQALLAKWNRIYTDTSTTDEAAASVLADYAHLLPPRGKALDLACGLGANALFLARRGLDTEAWDLSPVAIDKLRERAGRHRLSIRARAADVEATDIGRERFDVIVVVRFLERKLAPAIVAALKPGGLLLYQTFTAEKVAEVGPSNPAYLLQANELLSLFSGLRILAYREEGRVGDCSKGLRNEAFLIGQRLVRSPASA